MTCPKHPNAEHYYDGKCKACRREYSLAYRRRLSEKKAESCHGVVHAPADPTRDSERHRDRRLHVIRAATLNVQRMSQRDIDEMKSEDNVIEWRPRTRSDCVRGVRPCPFISCKYNLYLDVTRSGNIKLNFPDLEPSEMKESCVLDVADAGGATLEEVGEHLNMVRERVRQLQRDALVKLYSNRELKKCGEW